MAEDIRKNIVLQVQVDTEDAQQGVKELGDEIDKLDEKKPDVPFKNFKQQIKEATLEAQKLEAQFGKNSEEFRNAARRIAELRDNYEEFGNSVKSFNPDNRLQSVTQAARGAAGAVQGVTGAMQFLGVESGTATEAIARLQGLMAFTDALNSVDDIVNAYKDFKNVIFGSTQAQKANEVATKAQGAAQEGVTLATKGTIFSLQGLKTAIISTGIGALVVLLGTLVSSMLDASDATEKEKNAQERLKNAVDDLNDSLDKQQRLNQENTDALVLKAQAEGKSAAEIRQIRLQSSKDQEDELKRQIKIRETEIQNNIIRGRANTESQRTAIAQLNVFRTQLVETEKETGKIILQNQIEANKEQEQLAQKNQQKREQTAQQNRQKREQEEQQRLQDEKTFQQQLIQLRNENELATIQDDLLRQSRKLQQDFEIKEKEINALKISEEEKALLLEQLNLKYSNDTAALQKENFDKRQEVLGEQRTKELEDAEKQKEALLQKEKDRLEAEKAIEAERQKFRNDAFAVGVDLLNATEQLAGQGTDLQKGVAIASVVIEKGKTIFDIVTNTIKSVSAAKAGLSTTLGILAPRLAFGDPVAIAQASAASVLTAKNITGSIALGAAQTAAIGLQGGIAISNILSANNKNPQQTAGAGGGGGNLGGGGGATSAPTIVASQASPQSIQDVRVTNQGQGPIRAFITDRDLRSNEQRTNFLNSISTF